MNKILVCPVAFNEGIKIQKVIENFLASHVRQDADFLIVDDGSSDTTSDIIGSYASQGIMTIKHPQRRGVGAAIRTAIHHAADQGYEAIVIMAGNNKDHPDEIPRLTEPILKEGYDFIQGSRYLEGQRIGGDMPAYRKLATKLHPWLLSFFLKTKLTDSTNGFRAMRLAIFKDEAIDIDQSWLDTYELEPYLLFKAIKQGYRFKEVAVTKIYPPKKMGYTKMKPIVGWWSILKPIFYLGLGIKK